jgi:hypothetical protein
LVLGIGDWGLGIGDWGLGPIPNPQSPIPNPHNSILQHFDGGDNFSMLKEQEQMMKAPMQMMGPLGGPQGGMDYEKVFSAEKENIEIIPHFSMLEDSTDRLLEKYEYLISS